MTMKRKVGYNMAVAAALGRLSPPHAVALRARGSELGWWETVTFYRTSGKSPVACARRLMQLPLSEEGGDPCADS
jgi:hypothetical protein